MKIEGESLPFLRKLKSKLSKRISPPFPINPKKYTSCVPPCANSDAWKRTEVTERSIYLHEGLWKQGAPTKLPGSGN